MKQIAEEIPVQNLNSPSEISTVLSQIEKQREDPKGMVLAFLDSAERNNTVTSFIRFTKISIKTKLPDTKKVKIKELSRNTIKLLEEGYVKSSNENSKIVREWIEPEE